MKKKISLFIYHLSIIHLFVFIGVGVGTLAAAAPQAPLPSPTPTPTSAAPTPAAPTPAALPISISLKSVLPKIIQLHQPITVEVQEDWSARKAPFEWNKLKILLGEHELKTKAVLTGPKVVTFHWDESADAQKDEKGIDAKSLRKRFLVEHDRSDIVKTTVKLTYDGRILSELPGVEVQIYNANLLKWCVAFLGIFIALFLWLAKTSDIIRDTAPPYPPEKSRRPYSLGNLQMALWFFVIIGSFLWLWVITSDIPGISDTALILMGLSAGTGALAVVVDTNKRQSADNELSMLVPERDKLAATVAEIEKLAKLKVEAGQKNEFITLTEAAITALNEKIKAAPDNLSDKDALNKLTKDVINAKTELKQISDKVAELQLSNDGTATGDLTKLGNIRIQVAENKSKLEQKEKQIASAITAQTKPVSKDFVNDILTDKNGISFHRFQMLLWTFVLIAVFLDKVWTTFSMPDFDPLLLALTGISGATYVGFKVPERQI